MFVGTVIYYVYSEFCLGTTTIYAHGSISLKNIFIRSNQHLTLTITVDLVNIVLCTK